MNIIALISFAVIFALLAIFNIVMIVLKVLGKITFGLLKWGFILTGALVFLILTIIFIIMAIAVIV